MTYPLATPACFPLTVPRGLASISLYIVSRFKGLRATSISRSRYRVVVIPPPSTPIFFLRFALSRVHRHHYQFIFLVLSFRDASRRIILSRSLFPGNLRNHRGIHRGQGSRLVRLHEYDCRWRFRRRGRQCASRYRVFDWEMEWSVIRFLWLSTTMTDASYR